MIGTTAAVYLLVSVLNCTCAKGEGVIPHFVEVAVGAVEAEVPFVALVTAALSVSSASPVAITHSITVTWSL